MTMNFWRGLSDATPYERGVFLTEGAYHLRLTKPNAPIKSPKNGDLLMFFDFEVLASNNPAHNVGDDRNWCVKVNDPNVGFRSLKSFLLALTGAENDGATLARFNQSLEQGLMDHFLGETNPLQGLDIGVECVGITTKKGADFTRHDWKCVVADASRAQALLTGWGGGRPPAPQAGAWAPPPTAPAPFVPPPPAPMRPPPGAPISPDGRYWYNGKDWVLL